MFCAIELRLKYHFFLLVRLIIHWIIRMCVMGVGYIYSIHTHVRTHMRACIAFSTNQNFHCFCYSHFHKHHQIYCYIDITTLLKVPRTSSLQLPLSLLAYDMSPIIIIIMPLINYQKAVITIINIIVLPSTFKRYYYQK